MACSTLSQYDCRSCDCSSLSAPHRTGATACIRLFCIAIGIPSLRWSRANPRNPIAPLEFYSVMASAYTSITCTIHIKHLIYYWYIARSTADRGGSNNYYTWNGLSCWFNFLQKISAFIFIYAGYESLLAFTEPINSSTAYRIHCQKAASLIFLWGYCLLTWSQFYVGGIVQTESSMSLNFNLNWN